MSPHALISGAGIAGPALAHQLAAGGWQTTIVERFPQRRDEGHNIDVRGAAREVARRMGIEDDIRTANTNLAELGAYVQGGRDAVLDEVIERAVARGEVQPGQVSERVARVPVDLFRYELMMTLRPVPDRVLEEIVDDVFLPLVRLAAAETS